MIDRKTANIMAMRGRRHWPAAALLHEARKRAGMQNKKTKKADSAKVKHAEAAWRRLPAFV